jgi:hypothetical protein
VSEPFSYRYELRDGDEVVATGHMTLENELAAGDEVTIGRQRGVVERVDPTIGSSELQLVIRLESGG